MPFFPRLKSAFCQKKLEIVFCVIPHSFKDELAVFGKELLRGLAVALENSGMLPHPIHKLLFVQGLDILKLLHQPLGIGLMQNLRTIIQASFVLLDYLLVFFPIPSIFKCIHCDHFCVIIDLKRRLRCSLHKILICLLHIAPKGKGNAENLFTRRHSDASDAKPPAYGRK